MPSTPTGNSYSALSPEGDLYISSHTGVIKVNIEKNFENVNDIKAAVPFIDVDGTRIYPDDNGTFNIPSDAHKLTVNSFVFNYSLSNPRLSYQLKDFENGQRVINRSELVPIDYTNLRGGTYNFNIDLIDPTGHGDNKTFSVRIDKEKSFYEEFYSLRHCKGLR